MRFGVGFISCPFLLPISVYFAIALQPPTKQNENPLKRIYFILHQFQLLLY